MMSTCTWWVQASSVRQVQQISHAQNDKEGKVCEGGQKSKIWVCNKESITHTPLHAYAAPGYHTLCHCFFCCHTPVKIDFPLF